MNDLITFLNAQIKKVYNALVLRESQDKGEEVHLDIYLEGLSNALSGGLSLFKELGLDSDERYLELTASICFLKDNNIPFPQYRRAILGALSTMNELCCKYGGK